MLFVYRSFLLLALMLVSFHASAFCLAPKLLVSDEFYVSDLVLSGTVISEHEVHDPDDPYGYRGKFYRLHVDTVYQGEAPTVIQVYSENTTARFPMTNHRSYILFLNPAEQGNWVVDNCGNSGERDASKRVLAQLAELPLTHSFIYGDVYSEFFNDDCPPMMLKVKGEKFNYESKVKPNCTFRLDVPPGRYSAELSFRNSKVLINELLYKNPYCFTVPTRGSAGIAFRTQEGLNAMTLHENKLNDERQKQSCNGAKVLSP